MSACAIRSAGPHSRAARAEALRATITADAPRIGRLVLVQAAAAR